MLLVLSLFSLIDFLLHLDCTKLFSTWIFQLSDFGLAKWASTASTHITCTDVAGTFGYVIMLFNFHKF